LGAVVSSSLLAGVPAAIVSAVFPPVFNTIMDLIPDNQSFQDKIRTQYKKAIENALKNAVLKMENPERRKAIIKHIKTINKNDISSSTDKNQVDGDAFKWLENYFTPDDIDMIMKIFNECLKNEISRYADLLLADLISRVAALENENELTNPRNLTGSTSLASAVCREFSYRDDTVNEINNLALKSDQRFGEVCWF